jgi:acylphosphatase
MKRLIANVSGELTGTGYSAIVATLAGTLDLRGYIEILPDGRAFIIAEGGTDDLETFSRAICIDNERIRVKEILADYREPTGEFHYFQEITPQKDEKKEPQRESSMDGPRHFPREPDRMEKPDRELCKPHQDLSGTDLDLERPERSIEPIEDEKPDLKNCKLKPEMREMLS